MKLQALGERLVIEAGGGRAVLSGEEFATLVVNARRFARELALAAQARGQPVPTLTARPSAVTTRLDAHHHEVVLEVMNGAEVDSAYVLSLDMAKVVADGLQALLQQVADEGPAKMQ